MTDVHRASLSTKHAALEAQLAREALKPLPDSLQMAKLKKEKLRLKEQLGREILPASGEEPSILPTRG